MTSRLTEAMRESVAGEPAYVSCEGLAAEAGRQRRHWTFVAAGVALVLVLGVVVAPRLVGWRDESRPVGTADGAAEVLSLPDRVGTPQWGGWSVQRRPLGAASMIFTAENWWYEPPSMGTVAAVTAGTDEYRLFSSGWDIRAGEEALLSGDGDRVATPNRLAELRTGKTYRLPSVDGAEDTLPVAWSRDGERLAVVGLDGRYMRQRNGVEVYTLTRAVLAVWELATKRLSTVSGIDARTVFHGWLAAFSPDGGMLAYQSGRTVTVVAVGGAVRSQFVVPEDTQLAGKGAWTPDGRGLTLVTQRRCCAGDTYAARWQLRMVDPSTGAGLARMPRFAEQAGLMALRLLGWAPDGAAVVARYHPRTDAEVARYHPRADGEVVGFGVQDGITFGGWTEYRTDVVALTGSGMRVLLTGTGEQMHGVDIADEVIASGRTHPGKLPPDGMGPEYRMYLKIAGLVLVSVLFIAGAAVTGLIIHMRLRRRRTGRTA